MTVTLIAAFLAAGCGAAPLHDSSSATSIKSAAVTSSPADREEAPPTTPAKAETDTSDEALPHMSISPQDEERAHRIVAQVCDIVTYDITTYEFPHLWGEKSEESDLAAEYRTLMGIPIEAALTSECSKYAEHRDARSG